MIRIAFFISHPIPYFSSLFQHLAKNENFDFSVYYFSDESARAFKDKEFGIEIKWDSDLLKGYKYTVLKNNSFVDSIQKAPFGLINFEIYKLMKEEKFDAVILHGWNYISSLLTIFSAYRFGRPLLLRGESPYNQEINTKRSFFKNIIRNYILNNIFKRASAFLCVGSQNKKFYEYFGVNTNRCFFSPYAVNNLKFQEQNLHGESKKQEYLEKYNLDPNKKHFLFVGKLMPKKKPLDLVKAFHLVADPKTSLVLVGDGQCRIEIEEYITTNSVANVSMLGFINQSELYQVYISCDIFVLPSGVGETWGLVVNEAMNFKLPILVSSTVGCSFDLIEEGINGYTFEESNIKDLSEKIRKILLNENFDQMGIRSQEIINGYSYDAIEHSILDAANYTS